MNSSPIGLITGANKGLGLATARLLAQQEVTVLLGSRDPERGTEAIEALARDGISAHLVEIDVTSDASVEAAARTIDVEHGRLDILVNNAGALVRRPALDVHPGDMCTELETNVVGLVRVVHAMLPLLRRSNAARIVNVSSDSASFAFTAEPGSMFAASHESFVYSASKTAVNMLTLKYAQAFAADPSLSHVKINAVTPGYTATDLNGHRGTKTPEQGARAAVYWATVGSDAASGGFFNETGPVPW